jgi:hypothetical protein
MESRLYIELDYQFNEFITILESSKHQIKRLQQEVLHI